MSRRDEQLRTERLRQKKQQRTRQIYMRVSVTIVCVTILVALLSVSLFIVKAKASSEDETIKYKYYTSITVESGETLWDIAGRNMCDEFDSMTAYVNEVKHINHIKENKIYAGEDLIVPYYSSEYK